VYARRIERIVAVGDAQESCRKLESLGPEPRHLLKTAISSGDDVAALPSYGRLLTWAAAWHNRNIRAKPKM